MQLSERIRSSRRQKGLTQEAAAHLSGLALRTYRSLEKGEYDDPHVSTVRKIARAFDVSPYWLLGEDAPPPPSGPGDKTRTLQDELGRHAEELTRLRVQISGSLEDYSRQMNWRADDLEGRVVVGDVEDAQRLSEEADELASSALRVYMLVGDELREGDSATVKGFEVSFARLVRATIALVEARLEEGAAGRRELSVLRSTYEHVSEHLQLVA